MIYFAVYLIASAAALPSVFRRVMAEVVYGLEADVFELVFGTILAVFVSLAWPLLLLVRLSYPLLQHATDSYNQGRKR